MTQDHEELPTVTFAEPHERGGRREVEETPADLVQLDISGANRMLRAFGARTPIPAEDDGTVTLDEAGEWRYRLVKHDRQPAADPDQTPQQGTHRRTDTSSRRYDARASVARTTRAEEATT